MKIEFLGSGGAVTTPRPGCFCRVCELARERGMPYSRMGPSLFVHGPDVLIDTPEESKAQLNRAGFKAVEACLYSHWHPDHVQGCRVWEMNLDLCHWPPQSRKTDLYIPQQVAHDFRTKTGVWEQLTYLEKQLRVVKLIELVDGQEIVLNGVQVRPFRLAEDYVYGFVFTGQGKRILIIPDELFGWDPPLEMQRIDLAILPMGLTEFNPLTGERCMPEDHPVFKHESTFQQTLEVVRKLNADRVILTHIEEMAGLTYDDFQILEKNLQEQGLKITFAYDTLIIEV